MIEGENDKGVPACDGRVGAAGNERGIETSGDARGILVYRGAVAPGTEKRIS
jgi:hypothetical protein